MSTHNICFYGEIAKLIPKLSSDTLLICFAGWSYTSEDRLSYGILEAVNSTLYYHKNPKISDTRKFAVISLKVEQDRFSLE